MLYALTGIPLNLVMFQSIGERLNIFVTFTLKHLKKCFRFKSAEVSYVKRVATRLPRKTKLGVSE